MKIENTFAAFEGEVIHGMEIGRTLGYPTANLKTSTPVLLRGVFVVQIFIPSTQAYYYGIMNIGVRPSLNKTQTSIEVHILDFSDIIYGQIIRVRPLQKLRNEHKFNSLQELKQQIAIDEKQTRDIINRYP